MASCVRAILLSLGFLSFAQGQQGFFTNPVGADGAVSYALGQQVDITWEGTDDYSILSLGFYSQVDPDIVWLISNSLDFPTSYRWTVATNRFDLRVSALFRLYICNGTNFDDSFQSTLFAIRTESSPSSTTLPSTASTSSVSAGSTVTISVPVVSSTTSSSATPSPAEGPSSELSTPTKAGIGVGVVLGVIAILAGLFFLQRWRKTKSKSTPPIEFPQFKQPHTTTLVSPPAELGGSEYSKNRSWT